MVRTAVLPQAPVHGYRSLLFRKVKGPDVELLECCSWRVLLAIPVAYSGSNSVHGCSVSTMYTTSLSRSTSQTCTMSLKEGWAP